MTADRAAWSMSGLARLIMYHKHPISARSLFLCLQDDRICAFQPLPGNGHVLLDKRFPSVLVVHPAWLLIQAERWLGLTPGSLALDSGFREQLIAHGAALTIYLARFESFDPPVNQVELQGCRFITLADAHHLPVAELELLRRAYDVIMG